MCGGGVPWLSLQITASRCFFSHSHRLCSCGGVVVTSADRKIVCSNTLDDRLRITYQGNLPSVRSSSLFLCCHVLFLLCASTRWMATCDVTYQGYLPSVRDGGMRSGGGGWVCHRPGQLAVCACRVRLPVQMCDVRGCRWGGEACASPASGPCQRCTCVAASDTSMLIPLLRRCGRSSLAPRHELAEGEAWALAHPAAAGRRQLAPLGTVAVGSPEHIVAGSSRHLSAA